MTDDHVTPPGPDGRPRPTEKPERGTPISSDARVRPEGSRDSAHPDVQELSAFLDCVLTPRQTAAVTDHLSECFECSSQLDRLHTARRALTADGHPRPPSGAMESAIAAALASADPAAADNPWTLDGALAAALDVAADVPAARRLRTGSHKRATRRQHHIEVFAKAAAVVLVLGALGGGVYGVIRSTGSGTSAARAELSVPEGRTGSGTTHSPSPPKSTGAVKQPPFGALALQLRATAGPAECSEVRRHVVSVDGTRVVVNPAAGNPAVMRAPGAAGQPEKCIGVGPAFATAWSADVSDVVVKVLSASRTPANRTAAPTAEVVVDLAADAVADSAALEDALNRSTTVVVISQGLDLGIATVTNGPVVTFRVSRSVAAFLRVRLLGHTGGIG